MRRSPDHRIASAASAPRTGHTLWRILFVLCLPLRICRRKRAFAVSLLFLLLSLCALPQALFAASINWQALPDRERVVITMSGEEGVAGSVGRIALTGILVPFTQVPPGLIMEEAPKESRLFKGTEQQGRALVFITRTPEFGFLVTKQTPTELVLDLFPNPLGARWRPSGKAPTTEIPPDEGIAPSRSPDAVAKALEDDPQGKAPVSVSLSKEPESPAPGDEGEQPVSPGRPIPVPASDNAIREKPPVVSLSGSPVHAADATRQAEPPAAEPPAPRGMLQDTGSLAAKTPEQAEPAQRPAGFAPVLDARTQTAERNAPLPSPEPPLAAPERAEPRPGVQAAPARHELERAPAASPAAPESVRPVPNALPAARPPAEEIPGQIPIQTPIKEPGDVRLPASASLPGVGVRTSDTVYGGVVNKGGLEQIEREAASQRRQAEQSPADPAARNATRQEGAAPALSPAQTPHEAGAVPRPAQQTGVPAPPGAGNATQGQEPAPPDTATLLEMIQEHIRKMEYPQALALAESLLAGAVLDAEQREELLHVRAEMLFAMNKDSFAGHYMEISDATNQAMSVNPKSPRNAAALLRLGYMNLKLKNIPEAEARFNMLRRLYPDDENVPLTYYYWGEYHFEREELQKAADEFQLILQKYPNSRYAREAALALARSFYRLGYYEQAFTVVDYIERRWERFYVDYPPFLNMMGDVAFRLDKPDDALKHYWLYVNLEPYGDEADIILTRIGDIYGARREKAAARELYKESVRRFPDKDGALVAKMRLAEEGVNDNPTIAGMFSVFDGPFSLEPLEVYRGIIKDHPESALVPLAKIKLAMWHLWKREYMQALDAVTDFMQKYPSHELAPKAKEIALQTFAVLAADSVAEGQYARMREIWEKYPVVHDQAGIISPESRIALGVSYWKEGKPNEALDAVASFFLGRKVPEYSEMALSLVLSIYLEYDQWQAILNVAGRVDLWELKPESQRQLDYAVALAHENLGDEEKSAPIWQKLYDSGKLPPAQMAYATFFLARHAEKDRELERAYMLGREALNRLLEEVARNNNPADLGKIKSQLASLMDVAETAGRLREALAFANQYLGYLGPDDAERVTVRYRMARVYKKQGDLDNWKKILTEISRDQPDSVYGQIAASELKAASIAEDAARYSPTGRL